MKLIPRNIEMQLVRNLKKGDILAFNELFDFYSKRLYSFSMGYLKSDAECEELVQEVFTKVWERRSELKEEYSFRSYLFTIAFNIIRKYFRSRLQQTRYVASSVFNDFHFETDENIDFNSLQKHIENIVAALPSRRREIFTKSRFEGLSVCEIAKELNISKKTVENQLTEALKFIRKNLTSDNIALALFFFLFIS